MMNAARQLGVLQADLDAADFGRLVNEPGEILRAGSWKKAEIRRVTWNGHSLVVKDWRAAPAWMRLWANWLMAREAQIYLALSDMVGIPRLVGVGKRVFAIDHVPGEPISTFMGGRGNGLELGTRLETMVHEMHRRGVYHADLHYRRNILVTADGQIGIIDFASAVDYRRLGLLGRLFRPLLALNDHYALIKWKGGVDPKSLTPGERRLLITLDTLRFKPRSRRS